MIPKFEFFLLSGLILLVTGCGPDYVFEEKITVESGVWAYGDTIAFAFPVEDTSGIYNLFLGVDHGTDFSFQNLYVKVHTYLPSGKNNVQKVSLELTDKYGRWLGDCSGDDCEIMIPIQQRIYFDEKGLYSMKLEQFMRKDSITGIRGFSLLLEKTDKKKENFDQEK